MRRIRGAEHPHLAIAVGQLRGPLNRVVAIISVIHVVLFEHTLRAMTSTRVLNHNDISTPGQRLRDLNRRRGGLVIRRAMQQHRQLLIGRRAMPGRPIDIGGQLHAITHRHHLVVLRYNVRIHLRRLTRLHSLCNSLRIAGQPRHYARAKPCRQKLTPQHSRVLLHNSHSMPKP